MAWTGAQLRRVHSHYYAYLIYELIVRGYTFNLINFFKKCQDNLYYYNIGYNPPFSTWYFETRDLDERVFGTLNSHYSVLKAFGATVLICTVLGTRGGRYYTPIIIQF